LETIKANKVNALNQDQLLEIAECGQKSALIEWLRENGIKYTLTRKGRVMTTLEQINNALSATDKEVIEFGQE
jgi:arsenate reductase-like glutaredoxin family protein